MKALTIRQPWATLIALGVKTIETRPYPTKVRGRIAIHAGTRRPRQGMEVGPYVVDSHIDGDDFVTWVRCLSEPTAQQWGFADLPLGAIVATADLYDCVPIVARNHAWNTAEHQAIIDAGHRWLYDNRRADGGYSVAAQWPYGDFTPGRWAWLLRDVQPTTERCPACWGDGGFKEDSMVLYGIPGGEDWGYPCSICRTTGRCDPIPVKGRPGWWEWTP